jgi:hypothetical protein
MATSGGETRIDRDRRSLLVCGRCCVLVGVPRESGEDSRSINVASAGGDKVKQLSSGIFPCPVLK